MTEGLFNLAFTGQLFACVFMTGIIWMVQMVQYPGFSFASRESFVRLHTFHSKRITFVVGPVMLLELLTATALIFDSPWESAVVWLNLSSVVLLWALTMFVSVPIHNRLAKGFDPKQIHHLTMTNWFRTTLWSARSLLLLCLSMQTA